MKTLSSLTKRIGVVAIILGLSGCAATQNEQEHRQHHRENAPVASGAMQGGMMQGGMMQGGNMMDMKSMCEMNAKLMNQPPAERQKMMESQFGKMSPEMMQNQMDMMKEKCR